MEIHTNDIRLIRYLYLYIYLLLVCIFSIQTSNCNVYEKHAGGRWPVRVRWVSGRALKRISPLRNQAGASQKSIRKSYTRYIALTSARHQQSCSDLTAYPESQMPSRIPFICVHISRPTNHPPSSNSIQNPS